MSINVTLDFIHSYSLLSLSWPARHICPTYKESFQIHWDNSIPLFLHAAIYLEVFLFRWTIQNAAMQLLCSIAHCIICTRLFRGKMHSDWFNGIEILQGRWQHGEKAGYCYPSGFEKTLCKWDIYVSLVMKGFMKIRLSGNRVVSRRWTDRHDGINGRFSLFCERV
jgi:hypothetical protein